MEHGSSTAANALKTPDTNTDRQTEVNVQLRRLEEVSAYIDKISEELEAVLGRSILATRKPESSGSSPTQPEAVLVPLAQALSARANHLEIICERLSSILGRLEA